MRCKRSYPIPLPPLLSLPLQAPRFSFACARLMFRRVTKGLAWGLFLLASNLAHATFVQEGTRLSEPGTSEFGNAIASNGDGSMLAVADKTSSGSVFLYSVAPSGISTLVRVP